jgi:glycine/D-amino acid oxidase-like deaminating enzyme
MINKLVIFGVGLIGGSCALALREAGAVREIVGVGRSWENLSAALGTYVIDQARTWWCWPCPWRRWVQSWRKSRRILAPVP